MTDWDAATFDGSRAHLQRRVAHAGPADRFAWLAAIRRHAASTGALQAELERRAQVQRREWHRRDG